MARVARPGLGFGLLVRVGVIWGTIGVAAKLLYRETTLDAVSVTWLRAVIASPVYLLLAWRALGPRFPDVGRRQLAVMAPLGVVLILYQYLYLAAVDRLGVAAATLISLCVAPVLVAALSALLLGAALTGRAVVALVGALIGTALLVGWQGGGGGGNRALGVALALGSAAGIAGHVMVSRRLAGHHHPLRPLAIAFPTGALVFAPLALGRGLDLRLGPTGWAGLLYLGLVPSALAYLMYQRGLRDVPASTASIVTLLEPLIAAVLAWVLFGERLSPLGWLGGALLLGAIGLLSLTPPAPTRRAVAEPGARP